MCNGCGVAVSCSLGSKITMQLFDGGKLPFFLFSVLGLFLYTSVLELSWVFWLLYFFTLWAWVFEFCWVRSWRVGCLLLFFGSTEGFFIL